MKDSPNPSPDTPQPAGSPAPNEPPDAFDAYLIFFNTKGKRHLTTIAEEAGVSVRTISRWANTFDWAGRLNRYRNSLLQQSAQIQADQQREEILSWSDRCDEVREREWEIAHDLLQAIQRRLHSDVLDEATLADLARSFALASRIARLATGLADKPPPDTAAQYLEAKEFNDNLERIVRHHQAQQAAEAAKQSPSAPNP